MIENVCLWKEKFWPGLLEVDNNADEDKLGTEVGKSIDNEENKTLYRKTDSEASD